MTQILHNCFPDADADVGAELVQFSWLAASPVRLVRLVCLVPTTVTSKHIALSTANSPQKRESSLSPPIISCGSFAWRRRMGGWEADQTRLVGASCKLS